MQRRVTPEPSHHYHFVTGKLAEGLLRETVSILAKKHCFDFSIGVMPITVAALMTPKWLARHLNPPPQTTHIIVPGYLTSGTPELDQSVKIPVIYGPKDCRELANVFGEEVDKVDLCDYDIEIIAEINHVPRMSLADFHRRATQLQESGADIIDIGCDPTIRCAAIGDYVKLLVDAGLRVSIDTFDAWEANEAARHGACLVLSVNSKNCHEAVDWGVEVVVIPDHPNDKKSFEKNIDFLSKAKVPCRLDPILEPIGIGLTNSLLRYAETRRDYPEFETMMGIGNLTELTEVDSAGVNFLLLGVCQELGIRSVLTTEVINWARSSVRECDRIRRLVYHSVKNHVPPKNLTGDVVMLRDASLPTYTEEAIDALANSIKDNNYRILAENGFIHLLAANVQLSGTDPMEIFADLLTKPPSDNVNREHAFYLGFEMAKAMIALQLGKRYNQDQSLDWGLLTAPEMSHRLKKNHPRKPQN
ncbi:Pterin binding enzyme [Novipirellula aureliae]|uniref:Pterin binding enzyme n=1 Tax=Novipirellula aureliae TaxID=2527966 RepID=A0A5C6DPP0_9BACT|nr:DUF6513 domain-containing protein [Novipirellula aureliae]TWU37611.1 Pterin binding enzyme [Novipirellula aureliae]